MRLAATPFAAILRTEVLINLKRPAPYALLVLFCANAWLWWGRGPAEARGWATNGEFYVVRMMNGFTFMTLPLFTALLMGDPVIRDFRARVDPLIFSKPLGRAEYLLAKFFGSYFVLVCCQAGFVLTLLALQALRPDGMLMVEPRVVPYFKHFLCFVVVSNLLLAAVYFTVGTLTRSARVVYALATSFYVVYIAWQTLLKNFSPRWRVALDPLLFNWAEQATRGLGGDALNRAALEYDGLVFVNRAAVILLALGCFLLLRARFSIVERDARARDSFTSLGLDERPERIYAGASDAGAVGREAEVATGDVVVIPETRVTLGGVRAGLGQFAAALVTEFRLLRAERGLAAVAPMAALLCGVSLVYYDVAPALSYSAQYAHTTADWLTMLLFGVAVFYTGESLHRDRELRVEPLLWSAPAPDAALLMSKFAATLLLSLALAALVALVSAAVQIYKGHAPVEAGAYLRTGVLVVAPGAVFMTAAAVLLNVSLRDKHLAYAACLAAGGALFYLFAQGYNHWLYNPVLYGLWTPADLTRAGGRLALVVTQRLYILALAAFCLALAHIFFGRTSARRLREGGRLTERGWSFVIAVASAASALLLGIIVAQTA